MKFGNVTKGIEKYIGRTLTKSEEDMIYFLCHGHSIGQADLLDKIDNIFDQLKKDKAQAIRETIQKVQAKIDREGIEQ